MPKPTRFKPTKAGNGSWCLNIPTRYSDSGKRERHFYKTRDLALEAAGKLKDQRDTFGSNAVAIAPSLAEQATAAAKLLAPLGIGLLDAVSRFVDTENKHRASVTVEHAVTEFRKHGKSWSDTQSNAYRIRGDKLAQAFTGRMLSTITGEELRVHLEETTGTPSTFNHAVRLVRALWRWCAKPPRSWCVTDPVEHLEIQGTETGEIEVLTPEQARAIMESAEAHFPDCVPAFAIALFTGMRQAELERLTGKDVSGDGITVPALSAKTKRRRFIHMPTPLSEWLKVYPVKESVCPPDWTRKEKAVRRLAGFRVWANLLEKMNPPQPATPPEDLPEWPQNALRHTAATVALAMGKPLETLIFEHGHSGGTALLRKHYVGAMTKKQAIAIWSTGPKGTTIKNISAA